MFDNELGSITQGIGSPRDVGGGTGRQLTQAFITVRTAGVRELVKRLEDLANSLDPTGSVGERALKAAVKVAGRPIASGYKSRAGNVTGNLAKSVDSKEKVYQAAVVSIVGPTFTGTGSATESNGSGNHSWLVEWGTGRRRPGTQGRRTYINVHQAINGRMRRHSTMNDDQFAGAGRGYYFLMGSLREPTRQARQGSGYPHDFMMGANGRMHPMTLGPGDDYGAMPAKHPMQRTIEATAPQVLSSLEAAIVASIKKFGG